MWGASTCNSWWDALFLSQLSVQERHEVSPKGASREGSSTEGARKSDVDAAAQCSMLNAHCLI
jgi:hypothetical protein